VVALPAMDPRNPRTVGDMLRVLTGIVGDTMEARWITAHVTGAPAGELVTGAAAPVAPDAVARALDLAARRAAGEPLQYVLGSWAFRRLELHVDPRVLVPRPETEQVVEVALRELGRVPARPSGAAVVVDLGTGSGAIALSIAAEAPAAVEVWATDVSPDALAVAEMNHAACAAALRRDARVVFARGSWFDALPSDLLGGVDLVVSNPPYVSAAEWEALDPVVREHEPRSALVPGPTGFEGPQAVIAGAPRWLRPGGVLVVEIGASQADAAVAAADAAGLAEAAVRPDLAGRPRALVARRAPPR